MSFQDFFVQSGTYLTQFLSPNSRIYFLYLITAFLLAFVAYWQVESAHRKEAEQEGEEFPERMSFLQYVFDPKVWLSRSALQDMKYFVVNAMVYYVLISQFLIGSSVITEGFLGILNGWFGAPQTAILTGMPAIIGYTIVSVLAVDFAVYLIHYLYHRIPVLWQFHKVHHSAEHLNPMTLFRMHPLDLFVTSLGVMVFQAMAFAGFHFLTAAEPELLTLFGLNIVVFCFYVFGYNLRHSHIWLNYPVWLSKILISPAQHQIHHSSNPKHFDKNMGLIFSFWDRIFGTHYIPTEHEDLRFGLSRAEPNPFNSITDIYLKPFVWAGELIREALDTPAKRSAVYGGALVAVLAVSFVYKAQLRQAEAQPSGVTSLKLEELSWTQIDRALNAGFTSIIIPTGGTEQSGPFMALGKHNYIVDHTSREIAKRVGNTLVAPVMAYVPEGDAGPEPTKWMRYPGTLTLPEPVFEQVLEATALSLKAHGFTHIYLLGDSGDSQSSQQTVADRLTAKWMSDGVTVTQLDAYYYSNGQVDDLVKNGFTKKQVGTHAGIRDTSELMALRPDLIRMKVANIIADRDSGFNGQPSSASPGIGKHMLELKIKAGVAQIEKARAEVKRKKDSVAVLRQ